MSSYVCHTCGQRHDDAPLAYSVDAPDSWLDIPPDQRSRRAELAPEHCVIDDQFFFIRGNIEISIVGHDSPFTWGVWVSLSRPNFLRCAELWTTPGRENEPSYFGWLNTTLPIYPITFNLKTHVHTRPIGERPFVELEPTDHPLAVEQRTGITLDRVREIAEQILHSGPT